MSVILTVICKDEVIGEMIKGEGNRVVDWLLRMVLCQKPGELL